jgi:predicted dehydrogenase
MGSMHANCYKNIEGVELTAVADIRKEKAEEIVNGTSACIYGDGMDLIANADVDIIDICLPTYLHAEYAMAAMDKVKYVFVEKPVSLTVEEGKKMIEKSQATGCQVQVGQVIRFWDEYVELKKMVESGVYGKVVNANFRRISPRPEWGWENWLLDYTRSGGAGQDLHVHDVDYVLSLFGRPNKFYSVKNVKGEKNAYVNTLMCYDDFVVGVEGTWDLPASHPFEATFRVVFENAVVENAGGAFTLFDKKGAHKIEIEKKALSNEYKGGNISDLGGYYNELVYFTDKAKKGEKIEKATLIDGVSSLEFLMEELSFNA